MIFGVSFGKDETEQKEKSKTESTTEQTSQVDSSKTGETQQTVTSLDQETQDLLAQLIQSAGGTIGTTSGELTDLANQLITRGGETEQVLQENINAIIAESRRSGEQEIGQLQTSLATAAGSTQNTFVAGATAEAQADLEAQLAAQQGELNIAARQAGGEDLATAFSALAQVPGAQVQETANVTALVDALKGATTTGETISSEELTSLENVLQDILSKTKGTAQAEGTQIGLGASTGNQFL